jgi:hypothetical protein
VIFFSNILNIKMLNALLIAVLCFNSLCIILDNLEFDTMEIVDVMDYESSSEKEVEEKIEFDDEISKIILTYDLAFNKEGKTIQFKKNKKIENLCKKIFIPPPLS